MINKWIYPIQAHYYNAMARLYASEMSVPHFLELGLIKRSQVSYDLVKHNIELLAQSQADAISWASR